MTRSPSQPQPGDYALWYERRVPTLGRNRHRDGVWRRVVGLVLAVEGDVVRAWCDAGAEHRVCRWHVSAVGTREELAAWVLTARRHLYPWELRVAEQGTE